MQTSPTEIRPGTSWPGSATGWWVQEPCAPHSSLTSSLLAASGSRTTGRAADQQGLAGEALCLPHTAHPTLSPQHCKTSCPQYCTCSHHPPPSPCLQDVSGRLVVMSWEDWSSTVRDAAAQALGKTGHGKVRNWRTLCTVSLPHNMCVCTQLLHDELVRRLTAETEVQRLEALRKLHCLQLMTPQLLSAFLPCLSDHHASIRTEAIAVSHMALQPVAYQSQNTEAHHSHYSSIVCGICSLLGHSHVFTCSQICGRLAIRDSAVLQQLVRLLGDSIWHIRAHTLRGY